MGIGPYLAWRTTTGEKLMKLQYTYPAAVGLTALAMFFAWKSGYRFAAPQLILFAASIFALIANAQVIIGSFIAPALSRSPIRTLGGAFAHIGAVLIFLGIICLVTFTRSDSPILVQGHTRRLDNLPYVIAYNGMTSNLKDPKNDLKFLVTPNGGGQAYTALMPLAVRDVEGTMKLLARPAIFHKWWGDLYIALKDGPEQLSPTTLNKFSLTKGQTQDVAGYKITFNSFYVDPATAAMVRSGQMPRRFPVSAEVTVVSPQGKVEQMSPQYVQDADNPVANGSPEVIMPGDRSDPWAIAFTAMDAAFDGGNGQADFYIRDASIAPVDAYTIEVSTRPGIGLVWIGTCLIAFGGLLSMRRRAIENKLTPIADPDSSPEPPVKEGSSDPAPIKERTHPRQRKPVAVAMKGQS